jgi:hypothetical protein
MSADVRTRQRGRAPTQAEAISWLDWRASGRRAHAAPYIGSAHDGWARAELRIAGALLAMCEIERERVTERRA